MDVSLLLIAMLDNSLKQKQNQIPEHFLL